MTPDERVLRAQLGAHTSWANTTDPASRTAKARQAAQERFATQAREKHPDASPEEIERIAGHLRKAFYARMQLAAVEARRAKSDARGRARRARAA